MISELELDRAFANKVASSPEFLVWVIRQTKFHEQAENFVLLAKEQAESEPRKRPENWWRHWWCRLDDGTESETDIFVVLGLPNSDQRVALHIEDKPPHGKFTPDQYINYRKRAIFMANKQQYMNYSVFTTILLAPRAFIEEHNSQAEHFDTSILYEEVAKFIPLFEKSLCEAQDV